MGLLEQLSSFALPPWMSFLLASFVYVVLLYAYRLVLHPLASFPGPPLAAITHWYEFYYDFFSPSGQYIFVIRDMHAKYGPIVRISPDELHVNDTSFLPELMPAGGRRRDKYQRQMQLFGLPPTTAATLNHDLHRVRRGAMSKTFSKESIRSLEPVLTEKIKKLLGRLKGFQETGEPITLVPMFGAFTNDLISEYTYGLGLDWLDAPLFNQSFFDMIKGFHITGSIAVQFSWFMPLFSAIPQWLSLKMNPGLSSFVHFNKEVMSKIDRVTKDRQEGKNTRTVFDDILASDLPDVEKERGRLLKEARAITIAGTEPLSWALSVLTFHLLSNRAALSKLRTELSQALPDASAFPSTKDMERLPYLSAVISEGLRISLGTAHRQTRVSPNEVMVFDDGHKQWHIPAGTPVGITGALVHLDPELFPNPLTFEPERFIADPRLKQSLLTFSRGSRQCLGMHMAYAQLYLLTAGIWRRFGGSEEDKGEFGWWELFETDKTDVEMASALFVPYAKADSKGIRVVIRK